MFDLYLITPDLTAQAILERCAIALSAAPRSRVGVQLRSKQLDARDRRTLALDLRELTRTHGAALLINADVALALEVGADGVQLPERAADVGAVRAQLSASMQVAASRHDLHGVLSAERAGASFVTLSPIFGVPDKGQALGLAGLAAIAAQCRVPVFALGGIDAVRAPGVIGAGAHGVAVIRDAWHSADPARAVTDLLAGIDAARAQPRP